MPDLPSLNIIVAVAEGRRWGLAGLEGEVRERIASPRCVASADRAADGADCDDAG